IVGATPWKQQLMLGIGAFSCALIMAPVLSLLAQAYGIGAPTPEHPNALSAPQATLMASVAKGMFGGELPWTIIAIGCGIGAVIIALDEWLKAKGSSFRVPVLAAAIGIYLPLELMVPIFLGGLLAYLVEKRHGMVGTKDESARDRLHRPGTLFAAGLITGEALMGILIAIPIVVSGRADVIALPEFLQQGQWVGLAVLAVVGWLLYRTGAKANPNAT
ncbi:OPT/YSL family transporter, partial [Thermomonas sp.]